MSYARWGGNSDVYVYAHYQGHVECCGCVLGDASLNTRLHSAEAVVAHMREHVATGDRVPAHLLDPGTYDPEDFVPPEISGVTEP